MNISIVVTGAKKKHEFACPSDLTWGDVQSRACAGIDEDPRRTELGYKLSTDARRPRPVLISGETAKDVWRALTERVVKANQSARRTNKVFIELEDITVSIFSWIIIFKLNCSCVGRLRSQSATQEAGTTERKNESNIEEAQV